MIALLLLAACGSDTCHVETLDVADDAPLDDLGFTAGDVVADATGTFDVTAESAEHGWIGAVLTVARGDGDAVFRDKQPRGRLDFDDVWVFSQEMDLGIQCFDGVEVPAVGTLVVEDLGVDLAFETTLAPQRGAYGAVGVVSLSVDLPGETPGLPPPPEGAGRAWLQASFEAGELTSLRLARSMGSSAETLLIFPIPPGTTE